MASPLDAPVRLIACIRIPNLPVQAEAARRPHLRTHPFAITSGASTNSGFIEWCSKHARMHGVREGMSAREGVALCPELILLPADPDAYQSTHLRMLDGLEEWVPALEEGELGCAYTDITGMLRLYPRPEVLLSRLKAAAVRSAGVFYAGAGAARGKFVASVAAHMAAHATQIVPMGEEADFLAPHSIHLLPVSPELRNRLESFGLSTLGAFARLSGDAVSAQFGREGRWAWELARGVDRRSVVGRRPFRPISESVCFSPPVIEWGPFWAGLKQALTRVWHRKERGGATVRQLEIAARTAEERWEKSLTLHEPVGDLARLERMLERRLDGMRFQGAVESVTLSVTLLGGAYVGQESLFAERAQRMKKIREAFARIKARYGTTGLYRIAEVEPWSRIPERRYALINFDP